MSNDPRARNSQYLGVYITERMWASRSAGFGNTLACPVAYLLAAIATATLSDTSRMSLRGGYTHEASNWSYNNTSDNGEEKVETGDNSCRYRGAMARG